jgi:hypothetical protein
MKGVSTTLLTQSKIENYQSQLDWVKARYFLKYIDRDKARSEFIGIGHSEQGASKAMEYLDSLSKKFINRFVREHTDLIEKAKARNRRDKAKNIAKPASKGKPATGKHKPAGKKKPIKGKAKIKRARKG